LRIRSHYPQQRGRLPTHRQNRSFGIIPVKVPRLSKTVESISFKINLFGATRRDRTGDLLITNQHRHVGVGAYY
jgi:hypothetical protein